MMGTKGTKVRGELLLFLSMSMLIFLCGGIVGYLAHIVVHDVMKCEEVRVEADKPGRS